MREFKLVKFYRWSEIAGLAFGVPFVIAVWLLEGPLFLAILFTVIAAFGLYRLIVILVSERVVGIKFPDEFIPRSLIGANGIPVTVGESGSSVVRFEKKGETSHFLKYADSPADVQALEGEVDRLDWLQGRAPVPEVTDYIEKDGSAWLLTTALPGQDMTEVMKRISPEKVVGILAAAMRRWHAIPVDDCPYDHSPEADLKKSGDGDQRRSGR